MISVIVPVYNAQKWLEKCIQSIINQTYKDIEILLINDGSKDESSDICRKYESLDSRIRFIDKENEGVSKTRNLGIKEAKGEYIQFVDSDDFIEPDMCEKMLDTIQNSDMAVCGLRIYKNGNILREPHLPQKSYKLKDDISNYFELRRINLGPCNKLYRKDKITCHFKEDISLGEDTLFVLDYMKNIERINVISDCLYNVCLDNEGSLNRSSKIDKFDLLLKQRETEEEFLISVYGKDCNLNKMYEQYLMLTHAFLLEIKINHTGIFKEHLLKIIKNDGLTDKIRKSYPERIDYKIFKILFVKKKCLLLKLYFLFKKVCFNLMKK